jgi:hypothetical protein
MINPNDDAFPRNYLTGLMLEDGQSEIKSTPGLTKREYFTAKAMEGFVAGYCSIAFTDPDQAKNTAQWALEHIPDAAVAYADAQIKALSKSEEK